MLDIHVIKPPMHGITQFIMVNYRLCFILTLLLTPKTRCLKVKPLVNFLNMSYASISLTFILFIQQIIQKIHVRD